MDGVPTKCVSMKSCYFVAMPGLLTVCNCCTSYRIEPCAHTGPCDQSCSCIADGLLCSKLCNCVHNSCQIFYHGCRCMKGRCRTKVCPCFAAGRECDLDMCAVCCQEERNENKDDAPSPLSPVENGSAESKPPSASATSCQNRSMTLGKTKHMRVARSTMEDAGWGLFVDEFVAKDEFLIEYIGEMVSHEEAERRGAVYDKLNRRYATISSSLTYVELLLCGNSQICFCVQLPLQPGLRNRG